MGVVQLVGLALFVLGLCSLVAAPLVLLARRLTKATTRFALWPTRLVIMGIFGLALGYGMMWGPSLVLGAKQDRVEKAKRFE
ncbi:MAG: hypothetical protein KA105_05795 [Caulobacter sp.]|jgi:hypothetical protein|nr:hypothetical protein [Caulobacter sp.]